MKITKYILMGVIASLVGFGCNGGQIPYGPSGDGVGPSGISITDLTGASITDGSEIDPTTPIIIRFPDDNPDIDIEVKCEDEQRPLNLTAMMDNTVSAMDETGRWPQMSDCLLRLLGPGTVAQVYDEILFRTTCGLWDSFDNPETMDCWIRISGQEPIYILDNVLFAGGLGSAGLENIADGLLKKFSGKDFVLSLIPSNVQYTRIVAAANGVITYGLLIVDDPSSINFEGGGGSIAWVGFHVKPDGPEYVCIAGSSAIGSQIELDGCGDGSIFPEVGFIYYEGMVTPYYSFDGGETKEFYDEDNPNFDMRDSLGILDAIYGGIIVVGDHVAAPAAVTIDDFMVSGDARFVQTAQ